MATRKPLVLGADGRPQRQQAGDWLSTPVDPPPAALATSGTIAVTMDSSKTITPTGACTFNAAAGGVLGKVYSIYILTASVTSFVLTFGTNFKAAGTLATGTVAGKRFTVTFGCIDPGGGGTLWQEISRTVAM